MDNEIISIELETPIKRGESDIKILDIRKPKAGDLRNINLMEVMQMNVSSIAKLLPRVTNPTLTEADVFKMEAADLIEVSAALMRFFLKKSEREKLAQ